MLLLLHINEMYQMLILILHVKHEANFQACSAHGVTWDSLSSLNTSVY